METFQILTLSLGLLFGLGLLFSILLWCRSWRREEKEAYQAGIRTLANEVARLREAVELLDHTAASLQTADGQFSEHIESLRSSVTRLQRAASTSAAESVQVPSTRPEATAVPARKSSVPEHDGEPTDGAQRTAPGSLEPGDDTSRVRKLLGEGRTEVEIAKALEMGLAEVRMIARMASTDQP